MRGLRADVLVIGAGPAGSAAALVLARAGVDVILVDRHEFPRDKTCGDALLPDAIDALRRLELLEPVLSRGLDIDSIRVHSPSRRQVTIEGRYASLPRRVLDDLLREAAVRAGARFMAPLRLVGSLEPEGVVRGAAFADPVTESQTRVEALATVLATGAASEPLRLFGLRPSRQPSAIALRAYFEAPPDLAREFRHLCIAYDRSICPAYGWIFPLPGGVFNVGAGHVYRVARRGRHPRVRDLWNQFVDGFPEARRLVRVSRRVSSLQGAPLRTSFDGRVPARKGLLVVGEAAGLTYPFTGEGIGKAIESGILAGDILVNLLRHAALDPAGASIAYAGAARAFAPRFETYRREEDWVSVPWLCDFLCARAARRGWVWRQLAGMIAETANPRFLFSPLGFLRALVG